MGDSEGDRHRDTETSRDWVRRRIRERGYERERGNRGEGKGETQVCSSNHVQEKKIN